MERNTDQNPPGEISSSSSEEEISFEEEENSSSEEENMEEGEENMEEKENIKEEESDETDDVSALMQLQYDPEEEDEYDDDPIERLSASEEEEEELLPNIEPQSSSATTTTRDRSRSRQESSVSIPITSTGGETPLGCVDEGSSGATIPSKKVVSHESIQLEDFPETGIEQIPANYLNAYSLIGKKPSVVSFEIPLTAFGDDLYQAASTANSGSGNDISISMIKHQDPRYTHTKSIAMLLARACTLGAHVSQPMKEITKKDYLQEHFHEKPVSREDLTTTIQNAIRLDPSFCNHPCYIKMLIEMNAKQRIFDYTMEDSIGIFPHQIPITYAPAPDNDTEYRDDEINEDEEERPQFRTIMREHVKRATVKNVPQVTYLLEELVDNEFQPKGWRVWMFSSDPAINLGTNVDYVLRNSSHLLSRTMTGGRPRRDPRMSMSAPTCYQLIDREKYQNVILRKSSVLGQRHPIRKISSSEPPRSSNSEKDNAFFPTNVFHPYYTVLFGPTAGVCRAQRDPTKYFNFDEIVMPSESISCLADLDHLNNIETLRNANQILPSFLGKFPVPVLVTSWSPLATTPEHLWRSALPYHVREKVYENPKLAKELESVAHSLCDSAILPADRDYTEEHDESNPNATRASHINMDSSSGGTTNWDRVFEEANSIQDRRFDQDCFHSINPRDFYQREHRQRGDDPLSHLSITAEDKEKLFARDALIRFNVYASGKKRHLKDDMEGASQKDTCEAMTTLKETLLVEFEEKIRMYEADTTQIPQSFSTGYSWFRSLRAEEQWPEFNASIMKSDSGNLMSPFANMIAQIYAGVKRTFWLNAGEVQAGVMRALLCRNTALHLIFDIKCNLILWGPAGASKSMMLHVAEELAHPGSVWNLTHITENTFVTDDNQCYVWIVMEEGEASILGVDAKSGKEVAGDAILKNILTLGLATTSMCQIIETVRKRVNSVSILMASFAVCNNYILPPESNPMQSRFLRDVISVTQKSASSADLSAEEKDRNLRGGDDTKEEMITKYRVWHFYCHVVERLIGGIFEDVNMTVFNIRMPLFRRWMKDRCKIPVRKQMMFYEAGRSLVIMHAVYKHFFTETARAEHKIRPSSGRYRSLKMIDFIGLEKHLVFTEEMFVYLMTLFHRFFLPICEYEVMQAFRAFLKGEALFHPVIISHRGRGTIEDISRWYGKNGEYRGRKAITNGTTDSTRTIRNTRRGIVNERGRRSLGAGEGQAEGSSAQNSTMFGASGGGGLSAAGRMLQQRHRRQFFRSNANDANVGFYESTETTYGDNTQPTPLPEGEGVEEILESVFEAQRQARGAGVGESGTLVSDSGNLFNANYIGLRCKKKHDIVMSISTMMNSSLSEGAIDSILSSFMNRSLMVDDLNRDNSSTKKIRSKILCWMNTQTSTRDGGRGGSGGNYRRRSSFEGGYF
ncbi:MAG: hypothetical protein ACTSUE_06465, partial [Promethearchaeota archaeon]